MSPEKEIAAKEKKLRKWMKLNGYGAVLLSRMANFAWFTCGGDSHVVSASDNGVAPVLVTADKKYLIANNIEAGRLSDEELKGQGFIIKKYNWWEEFRKKEIIEELVKGGKLASDDGFSGSPNVEGEVARLRFRLLPEEIKRYKWLGRKAGRAMARVCKKLKKGDTEHSIAGKLGGQLLKDGIMPTVLLVASDERLLKYRHPIPQDKKLEKAVMVVVCARKWGLIASLTRIIHFGPVSAELRKKHNAVLKVDAAFNLNSKPGASVAEIFAKAQSAYKETGYADEWMLHHQGGATGYAGRDYKATPGSKEIVEINQAFAWNPSITGTKSEDTIIVRKDRVEFITPTPGWPMLSVKVGNETVLRPDILEIN